MRDFECMQLTALSLLSWLIIIYILCCSLLFILTLCMFFFFHCTYGFCLCTGTLLPVPFEKKKEERKKDVIILPSLFSFFNSAILQLTFCKSAISCLSILCSIQLPLPLSSSATLLFLLYLFSSVFSPSPSSKLFAGYVCHFHNVFSLLFFIYFMNITNVSCAVILLTWWTNQSWICCLCDQWCVFKLSKGSFYNYFQVISLQISHHVVKMPSNGPSSLGIRYRKCIQNTQEIKRRFFN